MASFCSYVPRNKKGEELTEFRNYRKKLGYETGKQVFLQAVSPSFQEEYGKYIKKDEQETPTLESVMRIPYIKKFVGERTRIQAEQKDYPWSNNSRDNYERLLSEAMTYNKENENSDDFTAVVQTSDDGKKIRVRIVPKNEKNDKIAREQFATMSLNKKLAEIFSKLGIDVGMLESFEEKSINGQVDFSKADAMADGFIGLIRIANNAQGVQALPEEFAHLIIGVFRNSPIVERCLRMLENNNELVRSILGTEYNAVRQSYRGSENADSMVAEEALGKVLAERLLQKSEMTEQQKQSPLGRLVTRLVEWIKKFFKGYDVNEVIRAKEAIYESMDKLGREVLNGSRKMTQEDIRNAKRNAVLNQLKEGVDKTVSLLENALNMERRRLRLSKDRLEYKSTKERITTLSQFVNDNDSLLGVSYYAQNSLAELMKANHELDNIETQDISVRFKSLRYVKAVLDSYSEFVDDFHKTLAQYPDAQVVTVQGETLRLKDLWERIDEQFKQTKDRWENIILPSFLDFLAPFYEVAPLKDKNGNIIPLKRLFSTPTKDDIRDGHLYNDDFDISFFDRWVVSMGNSSSYVMQLFNRAIMKGKDEVRTKTIDTIRKIWKIRDDAEKAGITSFEWAFEKDNEGNKTGYYISEYNYGQFEKDYREMMAGLHKKYGDHPFGDDYKKFRKEREEWLDSHAKSLFGRPMPNEEYRNKEFDKLSAAQKKVLNEFLDFKSTQIEHGLPSSQVSRLKCIQRRKDGSQRMFDTLSNPTKAFENIKESMKNAFTRTEDDDQIFGTASGMIDFKGNEYLTIPLLYTRRIKNPNELSTDIFSDLMAYAYTTNNYREMMKVVDPLEIGKEVLRQKKVLKTKHGKPLMETVVIDGVTVKNPIYTEVDKSYFMQKLSDIMESQVYGRYYAPDDPLNKRDAAKKVSWLMKISSTAQLGLNALSGIANVLTAVNMMNIEAAAGEYFTAKTLAKADAAYAKLVPAFVGELASREKQSELALFDELFDVKQDFRNKMHNKQMKNFMKRFFGKNWNFIFQGMGDHWLYNRAAIAMAMNQKVLLNGKEVTVWEAREIVTDENGYKKMRIKEGVKNLDGSDFSATMFSRQIAEIIQHLVGIYNDDDANAAQRTIVGRLALQMRQWIVPQMLWRFQKRRGNATLGHDIEGYYRTLGRLILDIRKAGFSAATSKLEKWEKRNLRRCFTEIAQFIAVWALASIFKGNKDPDRSLGMKWLEYLVMREYHELGFFVPSHTMVSEMFNTIQSPSAVVDTGKRITQWIGAVINPMNWNPDEDNLLQSGPYKGHGYIYKRTMELPLPPFTYNRQIDKVMENLDSQSKYYGKDLW